MAIYITPPPIQELATDPSSPYTNQSWVLKSGGFGSPGDAMGLLLALTYAGTGATYQFSYQTVSDGIKRVSIS